MKPNPTKENTQKELPEDVNSDYNFEYERIAKRLTQVRILRNMVDGLQGSDKANKPDPYKLERAAHTLQEIIDHELQLQKESMEREIREWGKMLEGGANEWLIDDLIESLTERTLMINTDQQNAPQLGNRAEDKQNQFPNGSSIEFGGVKAEDQLRGTRPAPTLSPELESDLDALLKKYANNIELDSKIKAFLASAIEKAVKAERERAIKICDRTLRENNGKHDQWNAAIRDVWHKINNPHLGENE